ncbi:MAG: alanine racemase C-terminal domain-containing protein [Adlercreutzia sp.]
MRRTLRPPSATRRCSWTWYARHLAVRILPVPRYLPDDRSEAGHECEGPHHRREDAPVGEGVSYGLNYRSPGAVKICTMPIGYADGFRRGLSGRTDVLLAGRRFHQVGNICMDQSMFEVNLRQRNDLDPQIGDTVTIVGEQGEASVTIDQMAETLGTIQHEVAIGFGCSRLPRLYV